MAATATLPHGREVDSSHAARRVRINRLGLWLFLASDGALFALFAASRFYIAGTAISPHLLSAFQVLVAAVLSGGLFVSLRLLGFRLVKVK